MRQCHDAVVEELISLASDQALHLHELRGASEERRLPHRQRRLRRLHEASRVPHSSNSFRPRRGWQQSIENDVSASVPIDSVPPWKAGICTRSPPFYRAGQSPLGLA